MPNDVEECNWDGHSEIHVANTSYSYDDGPDWGNYPSDNGGPGTIVRFLLLRSRRSFKRFSSGHYPIVMRKSAVDISSGRFPSTSLTSTL